MPQTKEKIKATKIVLSRGEGPSELCRKPVTFEGDDCWKKANHQLINWGTTAPDCGGYDKVDFWVTFADEFQYEGRFDLKHPSCTDARFDLADHIASELLFRAGKYRPAHLTMERYVDFLTHTEQYEPGSMQACQQAWDNYAIPSPRGIARNRNPVVTLG